MYATFARKHYVGESEVVWWILPNNVRWHDFVRGDGGSYSQDGPPDLKCKPGEIKSKFRARVRRYLENWLKENNLDIFGNEK